MTIKKSRSAISGEYITKAKAKNSPSTTVAELQLTTKGGASATLTVRAGTSEIERSRIVAWLMITASELLERANPNGMIRRYFSAKGEK